MRRLLEWLLGLDRGFLARDGQVSFAFDPRFPLSDVVGAFTWNAALLALAAALVWFVYLRRPSERRRHAIKAALRFGIFALVIALLNRPRLTVTTAQVEPSVLAVMVDDSLSMRLEDVKLDGGESSESRLTAVESLLTRDDAALLRSLSHIHKLRFYRFNADAVALDAPATISTPEQAQRVERAIGEVKPTGSQTRLIESVQTVVRELQGQRLAGVLVLSDGRETSDRPSDASRALAEANVKIFAVPVGSEAGLKNVQVESVAVQDSVFVGDVVNVTVQVRGIGLTPGTGVKLVLKDKSGTPIRDNGSPVERTVSFAGDGVETADLQFVPAQVGPLDLTVEAVPLAGEIDDADNVRVSQVSVLDANIRVLYVEGAPRWEYRFLKQELIRDATVSVSCLLTSADPTFAQEGNRPITRFPETIDELMEYDVVLIGDVDPRQFTDAQLALVAEFVSRRGGGLGMIAGTNFAPQRYVNTAIEPVLPVDVSRVDPDAWRGQNVAAGFRIALTPDGRDSSIFRFFRDADANAEYLRDRIQPLFWYCRGATVKPGVGTVLATHPTDTGPDGRLAPLIVTGRFGAGRTFFSAIDDTWRWRYYTGESIFDSYWTQTLRFLARGKKLGQRRVTLATERPSYPLGETARVNVRVLDPRLLATLGDEVTAQLLDAQGQATRDVRLARQPGGDTFTGGFTADRIGRFSVRLSPGGDAGPIQSPVEVTVPQLELNDPSLDRVTLAGLARETGGAVVELADAATLPKVIPSAQKEIPVVVDRPLWASPLAMLAFATLITMEWVLRKRAGMA